MIIEKFNKWNPDCNQNVRFPFNMEKIQVV